MPDSFCVLSSGLNPSFGTLRVFCGRKKLPFAGYSIVKDHPGDRSLGARDSGSFPGPSGETGGEYRARTGDLLVANQALSQLS